MRVRVDPEFADSLRRHLAREGFPASRIADGELEVLFPGSPGIFEAAAQLDLWELRDGGCCAAVSAAE